jgi:hypothetical protein
MSYVRQLATIVHTPHVVPLVYNNSIITSVWEVCMGCKFPQDSSQQLQGLICDSVHEHDCQDLSSGVRVLPNIHGCPEKNRQFIFTILEVILGKCFFTGLKGKWMFKSACLKFGRPFFASGLPMLIQELLTWLQSLSLERS